MSDLITMMAAASGAGGGAETDPNFNQTTLLLHGDGTNGAQNNTFLDSSTNNFTITRNGNTTQGTFSPFSLAGGEWSNYFDGTGDNLVLPSSSNLAFGTGDFCVEAWVYWTSSAVLDSIFGNLTSAPAGDSQFNLQLTTGNKAQVTGWSTTFLTGATNVTSNAWNHIVVCRTGTTLSLFLNGSRDATTTSANDWSSTNAFYVGDYPVGGAAYSGYISNLRAIKGSHPYDATSTTLTVPTTPLTAIANTSLLTCQSNRFVDNSTNAFAITVAGNTSVQPFSPFAPSAAYSPSVNGGSGYFDGTGDYLGVANSNNFDTNSTFTLEMFVYLNATTQQVFFGRGGGAGSWSTSNGHQFLLYLSSGNLIWEWNNAGSPTNIQTTAPAINQWVHLAVGYDGTTTRFWVNGNSVGSSGTGYTLPTTRNIIRVGTDPASTSNIVNGCISSLRFVKGTDVYGVGNTTITVPTAPLTAIANTELLCNFTNAGIFDNTGKNNLETVGNAQIDTTTKKYGTGSMEFDGTGDWLRIPATPNLDMGTGPATVECWLYITTTIIDYRMLVSDATNGNNYISLRGGGTGGRVEINVNGTSFTIDLNNSISQNTWHHFAVVRSGTTFTAYVDGASLGTGTSSAAWNLGNGGTFVGRFGGATAYEWPGYIDDFRITKGVARYTAAFTPPTAPFPDQ